MVMNLGFPFSLFTQQHQPWAITCVLGAGGGQLSLQASSSPQAQLSARMSMSPGTQCSYLPFRPKRCAKCLALAVNLCAVYASPRLSTRPQTLHEQVPEDQMLPVTTRGTLKQEDKSRLWRSTAPQRKPNTIP